MQYGSSFSNSVQTDGPSQHPPIVVPCVDARSHLADHAIDPSTSQRAAISKAYGNILLNGGYIGC